MQSPATHVFPAFQVRPSQVPAPHPDPSAATLQAFVLFEASHDSHVFAGFAAPFV
jgi:hypothetical protein